MLVSLTNSRLAPWLALALLNCSLGIFTPESAGAAELYVVAARSAKSDGKVFNVNEIITGKQRKWDDGAPIVVVLPSKDAPHFQSVGDHWFNGSGAAMQRHWLRLVFSGRANVPIYAKTDLEVLAILDQTEGAVGVVMSAPPETYQVLATVD